MKISFVDDEPEIYPNQFGGKARTIINLARTFTKFQEVETVSVLSRSIRHPKRTFQWEGINFYRLGGYSIVGDLLREASSTDVFNIHTCSFTMPNFNGCDTSFIYHLHDVIFTTADAGSHLDKALGNNWPTIIAPSEFAKQTLLSVGWWSDLESRVHVVPRGIDTSTFYRIPKALAHENLSKNDPKLAEEINTSYPIIFFPHRPGAGKGDEFLVELDETLRTEFSNPLIMITSPHKGHSKDRMRYVGWVPTKELANYYSVSDITLALSKLPESFSQTPLESIACGVPVIAFRFGNLTNLINEFPAIYEARPTSKSIYEAIRSILDDSKKAEVDISKSKSIITSKYNLLENAKNLFTIYTQGPQKLPQPSPITSRFKSDLVPRYFVSPAIAVYAHEIFIPQEDGTIHTYVPTKEEQRLIQACSKAITQNEIQKNLKGSLSSLDTPLNKLVNYEVLIRG